MMPRPSLHVILRSAVFALLLTRSATSRADDDPRRAQAETAFREGLQLHDADREAEALGRFEEAYRLFPSPNALYWIAREKHLLGRKVEAIRQYREALALPLLSPRAAELARKYVAALERELARVRVTGPDGVRVVVAGLEIRLPHGAPVDVEPGPLQLRGDRAGTFFVGSVDATAGSEARVALVPDGPSGLAATTTRAVPAEPPAPSIPRIAVSAGLATAGVAAFVLGGVFVGEGNAATDDARRLLNGEGCRGSSSPTCARAAELQTERDSAATASAVAFVVGGALLAGALVSWFAWPSPRTRQALATMVGPLRF